MLRDERSNTDGPSTPQPEKEYAQTGTRTKWYQGWDISDKEREAYRKRSRQSQKARLLADAGTSAPSCHAVNTPALDIETLMPKQPPSNLKALSLFSGGGGLDLGFDLAGYRHVASYELLDFAANTLRLNRPMWRVFGGEDGDVTTVDWAAYHGTVDLVHGGPPCQPFSVAGRQRGKDDVRDMFPEFVRAVLNMRPKAFLAENVPALAGRKFSGYVSDVIINPLSAKYSIQTFTLDAASFGVPQIRRRLFFVGFRKDICPTFYTAPSPTHDWSHFGFEDKKETGQLPLLQDSDGERLRCMGIREALGLPDIGFDGLAPTLRSTLTGPRHTTSIVSSAHALRRWEELGIWPHGVSATRERAQAFPTKNGNFRLSVPDCAVAQGFPETWEFNGPVYKTLGQIGNAVAPPVAYRLALSIRQVLDYST